MSNLYNENSIVTETSREFTRRAPSTYLGSSRTNTNLITEIYANAVDEHVIGHGNEILIEVDTINNIYRVTDYGQGFLVNAGVDADGETILQRSFDKLNTSGKTTADGVYQGSSLGVNGIGAKLTNWLSKQLIVTTYRDGEYEQLKFKDGLFVKRKVGKTKHASGTIVEWQPDPQFFTTNEPDVAALRNHFKLVTAMCPTLINKFIFNGTEEIFKCEGGLNEYVEDKVKEEEIFPARFNLDRTLDTDKLSICLTYTSKYDEHLNAYVNLGATDSGAHIQAFHTAFTKAINNYAEENKMLKKNDKNFNIKELGEGLFVIFNMTTPYVRYDSQNKSRVDDINAKIINDVISGDFRVWLNDNPECADIIINRALKARAVRAAEMAARDKARKSKKEDDGFLNMPTKLVDAHSKNRKECELFITEGNSAASGIIATRNGKTQAVFPIRGKILSVRKSTDTKLFANAEISNIVKSLGLEVQGNKAIYDPELLRYNKIILACDGDVDGLDIRMLLLNMFWSVCKELVLNGHVHVAEPPLFRVTTKNNEYVYLKDQAALNDYKKNHKGNLVINRMKG